jgi:hypothetical protein
VSRAASPTGAALRRFREALSAFSGDPSPDNLDRYLEASRALEASRRPQGVPPAAATDTPPSVSL